MYKGFYKGDGTTGSLSFGLVDRQYTYPKCSMVSIKGTIEVIGNGMHAFGPGCIIDVADGARLVIDDNFAVSCDLHLACRNEICIGKDNMWAYGVDIRDTDGHPIYDSEGSQINPDAPIFIGSNVWIGGNCKILKGVSIIDNTVIAASSIVTKTHSVPNTIITSYGKILKEYGHWKR